MSVAAASPAALQEFGERALEWLKRRAPGAEAEIYCSRTVDRGLELREGRLETRHESTEEGVGLRVLRDGRAGFAFCVGLGLSDVQEQAERILEQLPFLPQDPHKVFPSARPAGPDSITPTLLDPGLLDAPLEERLEVMRRLEAATLAADRRVRRVLRVGYGESRGAVAILNTKGVAAVEEGTSCGISVSAVAEAEGEVQVGSAASSARRYGDLALDRLGPDAAFRTTRLLKGRKLPTARRALVFDPWVASELLELVGGMLSADAVQRGRSLLAGKVGRRVGSELATFVDDPLRPGGPASSLFDGEGVPTRRKTPIDAGVVREYFYDCAAASKDGTQSNGSAGRGSFKGLPSPGASNFYLAPGAMTRDALIRDTRNGILVLELMGLHTADPVSGEFSVGLSGVEIQDGSLGGGVRGAMVSGNLLELLDRLDAAADDLTFYSSAAAPTFRVRDLSVA